MILGLSDSTQIYIVHLSFYFYSQTEVLENRFVSSRYKFWCIFTLVLRLCQNNLWKSTFGCFELGVYDKLSDRDKYWDRFYYDYNLTLFTSLRTSICVQNSHYQFRLFFVTFLITFSKKPKNLFALNCLNYSTFCLSFSEYHK